MVPNHYDVLDGELHKRRFVRLCQRVFQRRLEVGTEPEG
jgi:hypothetical protein